MKKLLFAGCLLLLSGFLALPVWSDKGSEALWHQDERSVPPVSYAELDGERLYLRFQTPVENMLLQIWNASQEEVYREWISVDAPQDYYVYFDGLEPGAYTLYLTDGRGHLSGEFVKE